jgi:hypothetical protein
VFPAARETCSFAPNRPDALHLDRASGTAVAVSPGQTPLRKWQGVAALFTCEAEIDTGFPPLLPMSSDAPSAGAVVREQMSELMPHRSVDLLSAKLLQARIQSYQ